MKTLELLSAVWLTAGATVLAADHRDDSIKGASSSWDTSKSCGKAHLGCQMGVQCACHYFQGCNPDGSYSGQMTTAVDDCLCEYGWSAYCAPPEMPDPILSRRDHMATLSILDERPGHSTLNHELAEQTKVPFTKVTVANGAGKLVTLTTATDEHGHTVLATHQAAQDQPSTHYGYAGHHDHSSYTGKETPKQGATAKHHASLDKPHHSPSSHDTTTSIESVVLTSTSTKVAKEKSTSTSTVLKKERSTSTSTVLDKERHTSTSTVLEKDKSTSTSTILETEKTVSTATISRTERTHSTSTVVETETSTSVLSDSQPSGPTVIADGRNTMTLLPTGHSMGSAGQATPTIIVDDDNTITLLPTGHPMGSGGHAGHAAPTVIVDEDDDTLTLLPTGHSMGHGGQASTIRVKGGKSATAQATVTQTVQQINGNCVPSNVATLAQIGNGPPVTITKQLQTIGGHTVVKVIPQAPAATAIPLVWDSQLSTGWEGLMELEVSALMSTFSFVNWTAITEMGAALRKHNKHSKGTKDDLSLKQALAMLLPSHGVYNLSNVDMASNPAFYTSRNPVAQAITRAVVELGSTSFTMHKPTQTFQGNVYVADPLNKYRAYDPQFNAAAPTGSCNYGNGTSSKKMAKLSECRVERCMWENFMKPINITTALPLAIIDAAGIVGADYFTHTTQLRYPHWGIKTSTGVYYPTQTLYAVSSGTATTKVVRNTPDWLSAKETGSQKIHGDPVCSDLQSCNTYCEQPENAKFFSDDSDINWLWFLLPILLATLLGLLCCLCCLNHRKRKNDPAKETIVEKIRRKSSQPEVVVNMVSGNATNPATGQAADPALATVMVAGPAAGADAAREKNAQSGEATTTDDGRGTTGRRAEEGRGRVNFEDGGHPGSQSSPHEQTQTTTTESKPAEQGQTESRPAEQGQTESRPAGETRTETRPAGQTDGTMEMSTGRHMPDMGSMRGRKRARGEGLHLGF